MAAAARVLVPLANGFEEIEAVTIIDVLRRAGLEVVVAGLAPGPARGSHDIEVATDTDLDRVQADDFAMVVLPGGMPGSTNLANDERVLRAVRTLHSKGRHVTAICAAPIVLAKAGVIAKVPVTSHPSVRAKLGDADVRDAPRVVKSGRVITSQGPGTAIEFALALVEELAGAAKAQELAQAMLARRESA
jgi:4-methyl-5(b-hydroxyethyl)-thiazole monophosphate biosynthesis